MSREKNSRSAGAEKTVPTLCSSHCGGSCLLKVHVKDGVITRTGTDDGEEPQLIASRMKKGGMNWTKDGGNRMAWLTSLRGGGQLHCAMNHCPEKAKSLSLPGNKIQTRQWSVYKDSGA